MAIAKQQPPVTSSVPNAEMARQVQSLEAAYALTLRLGAQLDLNTLASDLTVSLTELAAADRALLLVLDEEERLLKFVGASSVEDVSRFRNRLAIALTDVSQEPSLSAWLSDQPVLLQADRLPAHSVLRGLADVLAAPCFSLPLCVGGTLCGVALIYNTSSDKPLATHYLDLLPAIAPAAAIAVKNARQHSKTVNELAAKMHELHMLRRIDRELMDTMELEPVFSLTLDWALRFSNAHAASLALYDQETDSLYGFVDYGYELPTEQINLLRASFSNSIAQRVARSGRAEIIPDVSLDNNYVLISNGVKSHLSLPVMREDRVVAVISVESRRLNGFTDEHLDFIEKLASRAGVAIDNARLYTETDRERRKLSRILSNIADPVVVIGTDERIALVNQSTLVALNLPPDAAYVGQLFADVFAETELLPFFQRARLSAGGIEEVHLPDERTFYVNLTLHEGIGWIMVMHDITPLKQTDQLKTELVQTVSHDLKQPLGIMNGYVELLLLQEKLDPTGENYARMILRSVNNMRQLIDDLLDLAKIESGVRLELYPTSIRGVINESVEAVDLAAETKETQIIVDMPAQIPPVAGDEIRLTQIFTNLIGNAIKYSPPKSMVRVSAEVSDSVVRIAVKDNGIGIAPEDQARIFDRFYRVRRVETKNIEGTGLGLAIVKKLVEAHGGQIGIQSQIGEGSTFFVSLPVSTEVA
jgi:signal transduction histidine kinase